MIIVLKKDADPKQVESLVGWLKDRKITPHISAGEQETLIGCVGDVAKMDVGLVQFNNESFCILSFPIFYWIVFITIKKLFYRIKSVLSFVNWTFPSFYKIIFRYIFSFNSTPFICSILRI